MGFHCAQMGLGPPLPSAVRRVEYVIDTARFAIPVLPNTQPAPWTWQGGIGALDPIDGARLGAADLELSPGTRVRMSWYPEKYYSRGEAPETYWVRGLVCPFAAFSDLAVATMDLPRNWSNSEGAMDRQTWESVKSLARHDVPFTVDLDQKVASLDVHAASAGDFALVLAAEIEGEPVVGFSVHRVTVQTETFGLVRRLAELASSTSRDAERDRAGLLRALVPAP